MSPKRYPPFDKIAFDRKLYDPTGPYQACPWGCEHWMDSITAHQVRRRNGWVGFRCLCETCKRRWTEWRLWMGYGEHGGCFRFLVELGWRQQSPALTAGTVHSIHSPPHPHA